MPRSRARGGTRMPRSGDDTTLPPIEISPPVGCSRPATQRSVVVLPQPEGPSSTTISPAGTPKLTPSMAGRPIANCFRRSVTSSVAVIFLTELPALSLPIAEGLVPLRDPVVMQLHIFVELRIPGLDHLGIEPFGIDRRLLQRCEVAKLLDHEGLALFGQAPVQEQLCGVRMRRGLRDAGGVGIDRRALGREEDLDRRAFLLLRIDRVVEQRRDCDLAADQRIR